MKKTLSENELGPGWGESPDDIPPEFPKLKTYRDQYSPEELDLLDNYNPPEVE